MKYSILSEGLKKMQALSKQFQWIIMNGLPLVPSHNREVNFEEFNYRSVDKQTLFNDLICPWAEHHQLGEDMK